MNTNWACPHGYHREDCTFCANEDACRAIKKRAAAYAQELDKKIQRQITLIRKPRQTKFDSYSVGELVKNYKGTGRERAADH